MVLEFKLHVGIFPHHTKHCCVLDSKISILTRYGSSPDYRVWRKIHNNEFRYNNCLYKVPEKPGSYHFNDLFVGPTK